MGLPWQRAIVVGASSGIGAATARVLAAGGVRVALVARRTAELARLAETINVGDGRPPRVVVHPHDVTRGDQVPELVRRICADLGGLDLVVYAAGIMPRVASGEYAFATDRAIVEVNLLGAIAWLDEIAPRFAEARAGTIVGISSVAGDRGRCGQPAYCASKAGLDTYLEALRNRVGRLGVRVVTVKPGPVATPMTEGFARTPFIIPADAAARQIVAAAARGRRVVYVPSRWRPIMFVIRHIPSVVFQRLDL
jgi:decaprenylphospho-beta-D-erythro-pentofuranosid-2-ulose 2-reductase